MDIMALNNGKDICAKLKEVRQRVADANNISYTPHECNHEGPCSGSCPACEKEKRYLQASLRRLQNQGRVIKVAGVAAGLIMSCMPLTTKEIQHNDSMMNVVGQHGYLPKDLGNGAKDVVKASGVVIDSMGELLVGAFVGLEGKTDAGHSAVTDIEGRFSVIVPRGAVLQVEYIGCLTEKVDTKSLSDLSNVRIAMKDDQSALTGEAIVVGDCHVVNADDVYYVPRSDNQPKGKKIRKHDR